MIKTTAKINGMQCNMCESHVNDIIRKKFNVKKVKSSHAKNESEIISENEISRDSLEDALKEMGYELIEISSEPYVKKGLFRR